MSVSSIGGGNIQKEAWASYSASEETPFYACTSKEQKPIKFPKVKDGTQSKAVLDYKPKHNIDIQEFIVISISD